MMIVFGRSRQSLCRIHNYVLDALYDKWAGVLFFQQTLVAKRLQKYKDAIVAKGSPLTNVFVFIDRSKIETCRITQRRKRRDDGDVELIIYPDMQRVIGAYQA
ncbi:hypothetical protein SPRG_01848 [Saprolegnia parasitica CBS 223.65]|uniref:Uncharacterized protein n=1 Tax=Saprolegnia parasitica (strain CBS 223.65) TaxID=695850 RepID=A0A067D1X7_SAPPC|nr:hypothetical protein SPRG_01848 [Saprolegnia parasitica CBS 223.65]KDO33032.1 hypothetical protein SPRG_01848 [Saprolegnia parasitica CBS 223.65]|eukprot:XP_012195804.1 hypothetical protein SPRG_01848 [Saprolegnia parasitica CBS 223.65]